MVNKILISVIAIGLIFQIVCCKKNSNSCDWAAPPYALVLFQLYKGEQLVTDSNFLASLKLYYYQNNQKSYIPIQGIINANTSDTNIFYASRVMLINVLSTLKVKEYYLEYPDSSWVPDTLFIDYLSPSPTTGCQYKLNEIMFNKSTPPTDSISDQLIYIFNK
ncbi:hypothetical protein [Parafilimonas sp.]|uniref:hypothetical protein n=1 Tax=Parafilimonas sp. TaxID=1969739 RepID=UPI003F7D8886